LARQCGPEPAVFPSGEDELRPGGLVCGAVTCERYTKSSHNYLTALFFNWPTREVSSFVFGIIEAFNFAGGGKEM
jgi:hypothetical protein